MAVNLDNESTINLRIDHSEKNASQPCEVRNYITFEDRIQTQAHCV